MTPDRSLFAAALLGLVATAGIAAGAAAPQDSRGLATFGDRLSESFGTRPLESLGPIPLGSVGGLDEAMKGRRSGAPKSSADGTSPSTRRRMGRDGRELPLHRSRRRFEFDCERPHATARPRSVATLNGTVVAAVEEPQRFLLPALPLPPLVLSGDGAREELAAALAAESQRLAAIGDHAAASACRPPPR